MCTRIETLKAASQHLRVKNNILKNHPDPKYLKIVLKQ